MFDGKFRSDTGKVDFKDLGFRLLGFIVILASFAIYAQALPVVFVVLGGFLGVHSEILFSDVNAILWVLTSVGVLVPLMWCLYRWCSYVWIKLIKKSIS